MRSRIKVTYIALLSYLIPLTSYGATVEDWSGPPPSGGGRLTQTKGLVGGIGDIIGWLIPIAASLALLFFFWGLAKFILHADDEEKRKEGKQVMKWGIIALFVIVSIWGIVRFIMGEIGLQQPGNIVVPGFESVNRSPR